MYAIQSGAGVSVTELLEIPGLMKATRAASAMIAEQEQKQAAVQRAKGMTGRF